MTREQVLMQPLADRMRPTSLDGFSGQAHLLGPGKPLRVAVDGRSLHSMVLWGPPGTGKTTLARLLARMYDAEFIPLSAVLAGVKDVRSAVDHARMVRSGSGKPTILFLDEVHRFNKAQQDAFLPFVEDGTLVFVGATTENPSFELNSALLSRARVYVLKRLEESDIEAILRRAIKIELPDLAMSETHITLLARAADGDARRALNLLEVASDLAPVTDEVIGNLIAGGYRRFDKQGEVFYDQISALHKAVRGSNPDAALYWYARMVDGGCDPLYVARRIVRMASEDIGNADPRALQLALNAWDVQERLGSPEGELALAQAVIYMAVAAKSNAVYTAFGKAKQDAADSGSLDVPVKLRNAPTKLMKELGYGKEYRYAHDEEGGFAAGETYFPEEMGERIYYHPVPRGLELRISEKLAELRELNRKKAKKP